MRDAGIDDEVAQFWHTWLNALRHTQPRLLAYLSYMVQRLLQMTTILKHTGSIYLHCDPTASHYIKAMMDGIFGHENFRNEIIWKRTSAHSRARRYGPVHDTILFYSKSDQWTWNRVLQKYDQKYVDDYYKHEDRQGRRYRLSDLTGPGTRTGSSGQPWRNIDPTDGGRHWELPPDRSLPRWFQFPDGYSRMNVQDRLEILDEQGLIYWPPRGVMPSFKRYLETMGGIAAQDVITDIDPVSASGSERLGYATQKPVSLLKRFIEASTDEGEVVFDPFCGCGTTLEAAQQLNRRWIGIDIAIHAIKRVAKMRLVERCNLVDGEDFEILGVPRNLEGARDLWEHDKYHFQKWAVEQVDGFVTTRRTADGGVDGRLYFGIPNDPELKSMAIEVKGGASVGITALRALDGVVNNDMALMGGLIYMEPLGVVKERNFRRYIAEAGDVDILGTPYPRLQMLSVEQILAGERFNTPGVVGRGRDSQQGQFRLE